MILESHESGTAPLQPSVVRAHERSRALVGAGVVGVLTLHVGTLAAAMTRTQPHPPLQFVPFIVSCVAVGLAALGLLRRDLTAGYLLALVFSVASLLSFGPQKFFAEGMPSIAPAVVVGIACEAVVIAVAGRRLIGAGR